MVIGIIVDDSVIIAESIFQEKEAGKRCRCAMSGTLKGDQKPLMASLVTTAGVYPDDVYPRYHGQGGRGDSNYRYCSCSHSLNVP
ncbi:hypothetical protein O9929_15160 [Vibrio lentus]|nr:hypothetical protein [Vibrio lentus]